MTDWFNKFSYYVGSSLSFQWMQGAFALPDRSDNHTSLYTSDNSPSRKLVVQGLRNVGNSCYINSVLQGLASLEPFHAYLEPYQSWSRVKLVNSLLKTLKDIANPKSKSAIIPDIIHNALVRKYFLSNMEQQDSAEFLTYLFGWIDDEILSVSTQSAKSSLSLTSLITPNSTLPPESDNIKHLENINTEPTETISPLTPKDADQRSPPKPTENNLNKKKKKHNTSVFEKHSLFTGNPFCGLLESSVRCCVCGYTSTTYSEFLELSLPIISSRMEMYHSIEECLKEYTEPEEVTWKCEECAHAHDDNQWQTIAIKQLTITRHPKLLCIRLHQIIQQGIKLDYPVKFGKVIDTYPYSSYRKGTFATPHNLHTSTADIFSSLPQSRPSSLFSVDNYHSTKNHLSYSPKQVSYNLAAVICHYGSATSGHYVIFKKLNRPDSNGFHDGTDRLRSDWVCISDSMWEYVQENRVWEQKPYILFYERSFSEV